MTTETIITLAFNVDIPASTFTADELQVLEACGCDFDVYRKGNAILRCNQAQTGYISRFDIGDAEYAVTRGDYDDHKATWESIVHILRKARADERIGDLTVRVISIALDEDAVPIFDKCVKLAQEHIRAVRLEDR